MRYYVLSPNLWNDGTSYHQEMFDNKVVSMGWSADKAKGQLFASLKKGDCIIVAQRKNWVWNNHFIGIIESDCDSSVGTIDKKLSYAFYYNNSDFDLSSWSASSKNTISALERIVPEKNENLINSINLFLENKIMASNIQTYIDFLKENKNIILHGAPGTGKTYLAKQIAEAMGCTKNEIGFVQFHPSYDYTDFVEGLRPIKSDDGQIGFELVDGVFKLFCENALTNYINSQKTKSQINKEIELDSKIQLFLDDAYENNKPFKTKNNTAFTICGYDEKYIIVDIPSNPSITKCKILYDELVLAVKADIPLVAVKELKELYNHKRTQMQDSYTFIMANEIRNSHNVENVVTDSLIGKKDYVFIIDEINRGEMSKIFGELFYSIDPGYRGEKGLVSTQYQNMIDNGIWKQGFYIPDNVYIIGTMNDIDRSVESMDFAMRRRFSFIEVTADESADNMGLTDEQKSRMKSLNSVIDEIDGLNSSYHIGGSYFLNVNDFDKLWKTKLQGLLKEYLRGMPDEVNELEKLETAYKNPQKPQSNDDNNDGQ